jgi:hypothetical protein
MKLQQTRCCDRAPTQATSKCQVQAIADPVPLPLVAPKWLRLEWETALLQPATAAAPVLFGAYEQLALAMHDAARLAARLDAHGRQTRPKHGGYLPPGQITHVCALYSGSRYFSGSASNTFLQAGGAEVIGLPIVLGGVPRDRFVDVHAANGIFRHCQVLLALLLAVYHALRCRVSSHRRRLSQLLRVGDRKQ